MDQSYVAVAAAVASEAAQVLRAAGYRPDLQQQLVSVSVNLRGGEVLKQQLKVLLQRAILDYRKELHLPEYARQEPLRKLGKAEGLQEALFLAGYKEANVWWEEAWKADITDLEFKLNG